MKIPDTISVFGLGKLGLPLAVSWASRGFHVIGVDIRQELIQAISTGEVADAEPPVGILLKKARSMINVTNDLNEAAEKSDVSFVIVPTPSDPNGGFSTRCVEQVLEPIGRAIGRKNRFHLVSIVSTVLPGSSDTVLRPLLDRLSGKVCGKDFGLCYNPEFIALGEVVHGLLAPDFVLIGESDSYSGKMLAELYERFCENHPPVVRMSLWNAELAKISVNVYVTMKISFANTLASLCERVPGGDVDIVTRAVGLDSRIGSKYLKGGLGYGGPCFPRDNRAFSHIAEKLGNRARLSRATDEINADQAKQLCQRILESLHGIENPQVAVLGLTYKPNTFVVEESAAVSIAESLSENGALVKCYDPAGMEQSSKTLSTKIRYASDVSDCLSGSDFCVIATPWEEFKNLLPSMFLEKMRHPTVLDCWRILDRSKFLAEQKVRYLAVGLSLAEAGKPLLPTEHERRTYAPLISDSDVASRKNA
ncbi:MAG TPA: nucleotide sugar dehydrogenase [Candidatus Angelobacter sp.]|nr:nucleotide sugar dehydrogenase [Candidatus Angelobacter sp.]